MGLQFSSFSYSKETSILVIFLFPFLLVILAALVFVLPRNNKRVPPSPPAYPIIGHLHLFGKLLHQDFCHIAKQYGPLVLLKFGSHPTIVASSSLMAREFLKDHDRNFASRPPLLAAKFLLYNQKDIAFVDYGDYWKQMKKLFTLKLVTPKRLQDTQYIRVEEITSMIRIIREESKQGKETNLTKMISAMNVNVITRVTMGKRFFGDGTDEASQFFGLLHELLVLLGAVNIADFFPQLWWLDLQGLKGKMTKLHKEIDSFLHKIVMEHKHARESNKGEYSWHFVDALLDASEDDVAVDYDVIKAVILDAILGGSDTSTTTLEWALSELLLAPIILEKAQQELDQVVGKDGVVTESCLENLKYLHAIVKETFRLHPPAPLLVAHRAIDDCNVAGYDIKKGTRLFVNVWAIGRDPKVWDRPLEFDPDRFMHSSIDVRGRDFELIPFGSGRRSCPAMTMGLRMVELTLAHLLYAFNWKVHDNKKLDMEEKFGLTAGRANPLHALATSRSEMMNLD